MYPKLQPKLEWFEEFQTTPTYKSILDFVHKYSQDFHNATKHVSVSVGNQRVVGTGFSFMTPRENDIILKTISMDAFRILEYISAHGRQPIYDIGCGMNLFSNFYNVIGMDIQQPVSITPLIHFIQVEPFGDNFVSKYKNSFPSAIAINSLHYVAINKLAERINDFIDLIMPNGHGYITFNVHRLIEHADPDLVSACGFTTRNNVRKYIDGVVGTLRVNIIEYENTYENIPYDHTDGNVRIFFVKQ